MKISASMLPSARPHELTYVGFMTGSVRFGCDRQHLFRLWRQARSNCGATRGAIGLFRMATSAYGLLRTCAAVLTARASAGIAEVSELARRSGQGADRVLGAGGRPGARGRRRAEQAGRGAAPRRHRIRQPHECGVVLSSSPDPKRL